MSTSVDTKRVKGRRDLHYNSYDDLLEDIRQLAETPHHTVGNWSLAQIVEHLSKAAAIQVDGAPFKLPWPTGLLMRTFMKKRFLTKPLPSGFKIPQKHSDQFVPADDTDLSQAIEHLESEIARCQETIQCAPHPVLGNLTSAEWEQFNLRHAEMHMSFVVED